MPSSVSSPWAHLVNPAHHFASWTVSVGHPTSPSSLLGLHDANWHQHVTNIALLYPLMPSGHQHQHVPLPSTPSPGLFLLSLPISNYLQSPAISSICSSLKSIFLSPSPLPAPGPSCHHFLPGLLQWPSFLSSIMLLILHFAAREVFLEMLILHEVLSHFSHVWLSVTPWTVAHQASLSFTISQNFLKLISIELVMPSNYPIL